MSMVQLVKLGHKEIDEIDAGLERAERIAHDTIDIGTNVRRWGGAPRLKFCSGMQYEPVAAVRTGSSSTNR